jgi:hypothetical protein
VALAVPAAPVVAAGPRAVLAGVSSSEAQANGASRTASLSAGGRYVAFTSDASNLVPGDTNAVGDVFVRDRRAGTTERVSVNGAGSQASGPSCLRCGWTRHFSDTNARTVIFARPAGVCPDRGKVDAGWLLHWHEGW